MSDGVLIALITASLTMIGAVAVAWINRKPKAAPERRRADDKRFKTLTDTLDRERTERAKEHAEYRTEMRRQMEELRSDMTVVRQALAIVTDERDGLRVRLRECEAEVARLSNELEQVRKAQT